MPLLALATLAGLIGTAAAAAEQSETFSGLGSLFRRREVVDVDLSWDQFIPEALIILTFVAVAVTYFYGARTNRALTQRIARALKPVLDQQFSYVGDGRGFLLTDGASHTVLYGSGRRNCVSLHGFLQLKARQDLFRYLYSLITPSMDRLEIEVHLSRLEEGASTPGFVFGVVPRRMANSTFQDRYDLKTFTRQVPFLNHPTSGSSKFTSFIEAPEFIDAFAATGLRELLTSPNCALEELFVTDQPLEEPTAETIADRPEPHLKLQAVLAIRSADNMAPVVEALEYILALVDYIPEKLRIRVDTKARLLKARTEALKGLIKSEAELRQERAQQLKAEKKKIAAERVSKMSPSAQRKWEEKEHKKEMRRKQSKMTRKA
ncbi:hypothetical protein IWQ60_004781 [Tieghemiomyces parasiticus]|uniref:Uncharacterized protein n=1 Tax=Tieghemiomyces parasiticus TaxID=78921 RepID=A0A9W8AFB4_9FUNG|nr:hypothetical protein IWQ60_004781 [Tieghemiomyces parasiticus]